MNTRTKRNISKNANIINSPSNKITQIQNSELEEETLNKAILINKEHSLNLESIKNLRNYKNYMNINGKSINDTLLFRAGDLHQMTKDDANKLFNIGIRTIIDLREQPEIEAFPDNNIDKFKYINCPLPLDDSKLFKLRNELRNKINHSKTNEEKLSYQSRFIATHNMKKMYKQILFSKDSMEQIRNIFKIIINEKEGILFHCASGKDRTGIISALFLCMLEVNQETIEEDYYASMVYDYSKAQNIIFDMKSYGYDNKLIEEARLVLSLEINSISKIIKLINEKYGSIDNYIFEGIKMSLEDIEKLVMKFLITPMQN